MFLNFEIFVYNYNKNCLFHIIHIISKKKINGFKFMKNKFGMLKLYY